MPERLRKCTDLRSWSRVLAIACYFHRLWNWKFLASNEFTFQINTRQLFRPCGYSSVVSSSSWNVLFLFALCGKTVLERFQFRYFSGWSSHHQAYLAGASDWDGQSAFRVGLWSLSVSCQFYLSPAWINSNSLEREFERGPVSVSHTVLPTGVAQARDILTTWGSPVHVTVKKRLPVVKRSSA